MIKIYIGISILCAVIWLLLSGIYTPFLLSLGVLSCGLVVWLAQRMGLLDDDVPNIGLLLRFFAYLPWLIGEIAKAN
ncbi:MAG: Na+/H+ antiporter subunit E, partial [Candidatus Competibacteraceae bacterium]|nr:Na+/H+ antiporter subunit E [Candidatus Competibacteraceae bacterium]